MRYAGIRFAPDLPLQQKVRNPPDLIVQGLAGILFATVGQGQNRGKNVFGQYRRNVHYYVLQEQ